MRFYSSRTHFKSRDVLIKNSLGKMLAGVPHGIDVPESSIYWWMAMVFSPENGWELHRKEDGYIVPRDSDAFIAKGELTVIDSGEASLS
jgi:hypothetical protein